MFLRFNGVWKRRNYEFKPIIVIFDSMRIFGWNIWKAGLSICRWAFGEKRVQEFDLITDFLKCLFKCLEFILFFLKN